LIKADERGRLLPSARVPLRIDQTGCDVQVPPVKRLHERPVNSGRAASVQGSTSMIVLLRVHSGLGRLQALAEEVSLRVVPGECKRRTEMAERRLVPLGTKLELAERGPIKRIRFETITVRDSLDFLNSPIRTIALSDCDCPVEGDDRRRAYRHQRVVK
jgi:hypothetical protein